MVDADSSRTGVVESFDGEVGLGTVRSAEGVVYQFHCIEIADGTRQLELGATVTFDVMPKLGRYEASNLS